MYIFNSACDRTRLRVCTCQRVYKCDKKAVQLLQILMGEGESVHTSQFHSDLSCAQIVRGGTAVFVSDNARPSGSIRARRKGFR